MSNTCDPYDIASPERQELQHFKPHNGEKGFHTFDKVFSSHTLPELNPTQTLNKPNFKTLSIIVFIKLYIYIKSHKSQTLNDSMLFINNDSIQLYNVSLFHII